MNWDAIGAVGELMGAAVVVFTLGYLAIQVRHAKRVATDTNRIARATGVRDWLIAVATKDELRHSFDLFTGMADLHQAAAVKFGVDKEDASRAHYAIIYFFWLHWGPFSSSTHDEDIEELRNLIDVWYRTPAVRHEWDNSPLVKPILAKSFIDFVEEILKCPPTDTAGDTPEPMPSLSLPQR